MENIWKPKGALKSQMPDAGGAVLRQLPMLGIVKDTVDPTRSGRIRVYISALGGRDPNDENNWTPVMQMSSFFGATSPTSGKTGYGSYKANPVSYGMWNSPPDIGTSVICLFINGDPNFGFYIGSIPDAEAMRMIPAIGANFSKEDVLFDKSEANSYGGATRLPVTNMNTNNSNEADNSTFLNSPKPVHSYQASIMFQQGVLRDPIRGPISSSAQRETPSRVGWGVSTPGRPIYEGGQTDETISSAANSDNANGLNVVSRRGGHSIVMDDGDLVGQDNLVRIRTSLGHQILMSDDGQTMMFLHSNGQSYIELGKEGTVDVYSTNSVNIRTHGDLNLHADNNININAAKKLNIQADEININSENSINQKAGTDYKVYTKGKHTHKVDGPMSMASGGDASFASGATTFINGGPRINLNTGQSSTTPEAVPPIPLVAQTDTLFDASKGWAAAPAKLLTIASRAPAHTPWANANQGVDVKVNLNASSQLPSSPSPAIAEANNVAASTPNVSGTTVAGISTTPPVTAASDSLDKNTTSAVVSAVAVQAATGDTASAVQSGAGVVTDAVGQVTGVAVGATGLSASALEASSILKPGSAALVNSLVQTGSNIQTAMSGALFTGTSGITNLTSLTTNVQAQVDATVTNLQQAQTALVQTGVITGTESPTAIAGVVMSAATNGVESTVSTVQNLATTAGSTVNSLTTNVSGAANSVMNSMLGGNSAASLAQNVTSGLSGISKAIGSLGGGIAGAIESAKGVAAGAFAAITKSFKAFEAGVPQNLKAITEKSASEVAGSVPSVGSLASGVSALPGGTGTIARVVDNAATAINTVPGTEGIKTLINNSTTAVTNGISLPSSITAATGMTATSLTTSVTGALDQLKSGAASLAGLASTGLPAGAAAQLNSAIASLGSGGALPIKMPTVATNTTDRGEVASAIGSLLPAGVPKPNFSGIPTASKSAVDAQQQTQSDNQKKLADLNEKYELQKKAVEQAEAAYFSAKVSAPPGDPSIQVAKTAWDAEIKKQADISKEIATLMGINVSIPGLSALQSQGSQLTAAGQSIETALRTAPAGATGPAPTSFNNY